MKTNRRLRVVLISLLIVGAFGASGPASTMAYFEGTHEATGTLSADVGYSTNPGSGGGNDDPGPNGPKAYNDENNNGVYDSNEEKINKNKIADYNNQNANLVIPSDVGSVKPNKGDVSITARSITSEVDIESDSGRVMLDARDGDVELGGKNVTGGDGNVEIEAPNGSVDVSESNLSTNADQGEVRISANHAITLDGARLEGTKNGVHVESDGMISLDDAVVDIKSDIGDIYLNGETVSALGAELLSNQRSIEVTARSGSLAVDNSDIVVAGAQGQISLAGRSVTGAGTNVSTHKGPVQIAATESDGGTMDLSGATISNRASLGGITLASVGDMNLNSTTIRTAKDASADIGTSDSVLFVDGIEMDDADGSLTYQPSDVNVVPERNDVVASG